MPKRNGIVGQMAKVGYIYIFQEKYNEQIAGLQEKLDTLKVEQAKYHQSKEMKTKQMVHIYENICASFKT